MPFPIAATPALRGKDAKAFIRGFLNPEKPDRRNAPDPAKVRERILEIMRKRNSFKI